MRRVPQHIINKLKEVRATATMETASFGFPNDEVIATHHGERGLIAHPTDYIKERTRPWRHSWVIGPLDEILEWAEGEQ